MILHAVSAVNCGYKRIIVLCRDTDVLILLIHFFNKIAANEIWMSAGTKAKPKYEMSDHVCNSLLGFFTQFHSVFGCDTTSSCLWHGKKTAWHIFISNPNLLKDIGKGRLDERILSGVEIFIVRLYSPTSTCSSVNELCDAMFKKKNPEALPPTKDALNLHVKRSPASQYLVFINCLQTCLYKI